MNNTRKERGGAAGCHSHQGNGGEGPVGASVTRRVEENAHSSMLLLLEN